MARLYPLSMVATALVAVLNSLVLPQIAMGQAERYFPESTKGFVSITNLEDFANRLDQTGVGDLRREPEAKEFFDSFVEQIKLRIQKRSKVSLGLTLEELKSIVDGEVAVGLVQPQENLLAVITLAEFKDAKKVDDALKKIEANLLTGTPETEKVKLVNRMKVGGHTIAHYEFPDPFGIAGPPQVFYGRTDKYIVAYSGPVLPDTKKEDHIAEVKSLLQALSGEKKPSLADSELFQTTMKNLAKEDQYKNHQAKWFIESFGFVDAAKKVWPNKLKDVQIGSFRKVGFDSIKSVGGLGMITPGEREFQIRAFVYAPPVDEKNRFRSAAKMLDLTADKNTLLDLPVWVDKTASSYLAVHARVLNAFDSAEPLINELYGEGTMKQILENFKTNPKLKANFDLRNELAANLDNRMVAIRDPAFPAKEGRNRVIFAVDIAPELKTTTKLTSGKKKDDKILSRREQVYKVVKGYMANEDPNFVEKIIHKVDGNEITVFKKNTPPEEDAAEPGELELDLDDLDLDDLDLDEEPEAKPAAGADGKGKDPLIQYICVAQYNNQVLVSTDLELMKQVLSRSAQNKSASLQEMEWFQKVNSELDKVKNQSFESLRYALRLDLPYKAVFQLIKESKGDLPIEKMIKNLMEEDEDTRLFDLSKLPKDFDKTISPHLGYVGWSMTTEKDGWMFNGIVLRKSPVKKADK